MANTIFTGPVGPRRNDQALAGLRQIIADDQNKRQSTLTNRAIQQEDSSLEAIEGLSDFKGTPQEAIQELLRTGGAPAVLQNLPKLFDLIGEGGGPVGLTPEQQARVLPKQSVSQQLPKAKEVSPEQTPQQGKLLAQIEKTQAAIDAIKAENAEKVGGQQILTDLEIEDISGPQIKKLEAQKQNMMKRLGQGSIDPQTGDVNIGLEKPVSKKEKQQSRFDSERKRLEGLMGLGEEALAIRANNPNLDEGSIALLDSRIADAKAARTNLSTLNSEELKSKSPIVRVPTKQVGPAGQSIVRLMRETFPGSGILENVVDENGNPQTGFVGKGNKLDLNVSGSLTKPTLGKLQQDVISASKRMKRLDSVEATARENPDLFRFSGKTAAAVQEFLQKTPFVDNETVQKGLELVGIDKDIAAKQADFIVDAQNEFLLWRKFITGVAGGEKEMEVIGTSFYNVSSDSQETFLAKLERVRKITDDVIAESKKFLGKGTVLDPADLQSLQEFTRDKVIDAGLARPGSLEPDTKALEGKSVEELLKMFQGAK